MATTNRRLGWMGEGFWSLIVTCVLSVTALSSTAVDDNAAEKLVLEGSTTVQKHIELIQDKIEENIGVHVSVTGTGSGDGFKKILSGELDYSVSSSSLPSLVKKYNISDEAASSVKVHVIGKNTMHVVVNKKNPVKTLSLAQISDIYTGKIKDWSEVGGTAGPIKLITPYKNSGTIVEFKKLVMKGKDYDSDAKSVKTPRYVVKIVSKRPNAIGIISGDFLKNAKTLVHIIETDPIERNLYLFTKGKVEGTLKKVLNYLQKS